METVYVPLLDEGTTVWRPVAARNQGAGVWELDPAAVADEDERWAFGPGERVEVERRTLTGGDAVLVAVRRVPRAT